ncbi:hypothetical protein HMPREF9599_01874 [Cutibacterium acnes HL050PA2]|nr:hypothetical protein HMPREF9599_01874 [Cutibacterium acnes HL050PA2]
MELRASRYQRMTTTSPCYVPRTAQNRNRSLARRHDFGSHPQDL